MGNILGMEWESDDLSGTVEITNKVEIMNTMEIILYQAYILCGQMAKTWLKNVKDRCLVFQN